MSAATLACPHPWACGARRHLTGSAEVALCAGAPALLDEAFARLDEEPVVGSYDAVVGMTSSHTRSDGVRAHTRIVKHFHRTALHRVDGPALVEVNTRSGAVCSWAWAREGLAHRSDAPATWHRYEGGGRYFHRGRDLGGTGDRQVRAHLGELLAAGVDPTDVVGWLRWPAPVAARLAALADVDQVVDLLVQGVTDPDDLAAVLSGAVPASWAATRA